MTLRDNKICFINPSREIHQTTCVWPAGGVLRGPCDTTRTNSTQKSRGRAEMNRKLITMSLSCHILWYRHCREVPDWAACIYPLNNFANNDT